MKLSHVAICSVVALSALSSAAVSAGAEAGATVTQADSLLANDTTQPATANDSIPAVAEPVERRDRQALLERRKVTNSPEHKIVRDKADLDNVVDFKATDSVILVGRTDALMYGQSQVVYGDIKLDAAQIEMDIPKNTVYAVGRADTTGGETTGDPVFEDHGTSYEAKTMDYNFKTGRGYITDVSTQQGEGYLTGGETKKIDENTLYVHNGRYSTCDERECPHFYMQLTKAKVRPGKDVVSGPAYMVLAGLPLPLAVPFGYFPFSEKYSSGVIFPTFGDDYNRGFYLSDGGYYLALSDNMDLALTGEIYTKGSWGLQATSAYAKRYKYSGSFNISYLNTIDGEKGMPDYAKMTNFQVLWNHTQDPKANPNMTLSASVNYTTSGYTRNDLNSYYSNAFTENTKSSTVNMTYRFPESKWSLSTTANLAQRTQDSTLSVSFPNVTLTMAQTAPFKRKKAVGDEKWYEKIKISYSGMFNNSLTAKQNEFFKKSLIKDWRNGMKHSVPISATFNAFNYVNITPSITVTDRMYTSKIRRQWDPNASREICDTSYSFYNVWDFSGSVSLDTKIYGFYQPLPFLGDKVKMIRHVFTPTITLSGAPDFGSPFFGYYGKYQVPNKDGGFTERTYSYFQHGLFGVPGQGKSGIVSVNLANNVEMKVKSDNDSIGEKKISLIESLNLSQSYNFAADSMRWSNISANMMLRLTQNFNLNLQSTWDVYTYQLSPGGSPVRVNRTRLQAGKGLAKLSSAGTSFSYTFNNGTFKRGGSKDKGSKKKSEQTEDQMFAEETSDFEASPISKQKDREKGKTQLGADGYAPWAFPWSLSVNYSVNYGYGNFDKEKMEYKGKFTQNLSLSGNVRPTPNWNFGFSASYDFETHKIAYMNCNISRDLHCWTMRASFIPVGPYKSYNFHISVKSSLLSDLKYDKRSSSRNGITWY